jgi:hypothetical protein
VHLERQVVLLSRDTGLASIVGLAMANGDRVAHLHSPAELTDWSPVAVTAVVLDSRPPNHQLSYKQVRDRYRGPLVMLLDRGERRPNLPPDGARRYLHRPFSAADLAAVLARPPAALGTLENAIIDTWGRHAAPDPPSPLATDGLSYRTSWGPSTRRRVRIWAATVAALMGLLLVFNVSDQGPCGPGCTSFGAAPAGAAEIRTPLTSRPPSNGGGSGGGGGSATPVPGLGPAPGGIPLASGIGDLIESINPITPTDTTPPPASPEPVPGVPSPAPPPGTNPPPGTTPPTTVPPPTAPPTTAPPTTEPPPTTAPPTTAPPTTEPPTTAPPTTEPPTTAPPTTEPPTTAPPTTEPPTTAATSDPPPSTATPTS